MKLKPSAATVETAATQVAKFCALAQAEQIDARSMLGRLCTFVSWVATQQCYIRDIHSKIIPLAFNSAQVLVLATMMMQAARDRPIRVVILKARKLGVSTLVQAWFYFLCRHYRNERALTLAHQTEATGEIFDITRRVGQKDPQGLPRVNRRMLFFPSDSMYSCHTAGGKGVGAGGTPSLLHRSEMALWREQKVETIYTSGNAVPEVPSTCIIDESTARGREEFFSEFEDAHDAAHGFEPLFLPWFLDDRLTAPLGDSGVPSDEEAGIRRTAAVYGLVVSDEQLAWRRVKIAELGEDTFRQEFPSTPSEAVQARKGLVLPGLRECIIDDLPFDPRMIDNADRQGGVDFGYGDPTVILTAYTVGGALWIVGLYRESGALSEDHAEGLWNGHRYWCDPSGLQARHELRQAARVQCELLQAPAVKAAEDDWDRVRKLIREGGLRIMRDVSHQLVLEADNFAYDPSSGKPKHYRSEACGHFDCLDGLRYAVTGMLRGGVEIPMKTERRITRREEMRRW